MGNIISCRPESFGKYHDQAYATLQKLGVRYVEITAPGRDHVTSTARTLDKYGLRAASLCVYTAMKESNFAAHLEAAAEAGAELNAEVIFTSQHTHELPLPQVYGLLRKAGDIVGKHGLTLVLETHPDLCANGAQARATMEAVAHPQVRINFDPANIYYYNEGADAVAELRQVAPWVRSVHLKDTTGGYKTWNFPALGEGVVDWPGIFAIMQEHGVQGPYSMELEGIEGEELSFEQTTERVSKSLEFLKAQGLME